MGEEADCVSTIVNTTLAERLPGGEGQQLPVGAPCNNFQGYCDILNNCFIVDNEGIDTLYTVGVGSTIQ